MNIVARYSFNNGLQEIERRYPKLLSEITDIVDSIDAENCRVKQSNEKSRKYKVLYDPKALNRAFKSKFKELDWKPKKVKCQYSSEYYIEDYKPSNKVKQPYREMDFVKEKLGVEIQFGKYAFMVYNVCAKMTIFKNLGYIDYGIEIVPVRELAQSMSTGVAYFEQFVWDLENRGVSNIDTPVLVIGIRA